ncbi:PEPxxWA-CTERM sorting domain-containing protein [Sphingomonas aerolata]|uniref:PEPxxWA-CTERM sorting domain-containing protein n=1 Tax=Sphingomonas aerolata TaxID=185951 RepID=UPI00334FD138
MKLIAIVASLVVGAAPAQATVYVGDLTGFVDRIGSLSSDYTSTGAIKAGDPIRIRLSIDTSSFGSSLTKVNQEATAVYAVPISYTLDFGTFSRTSSYSNYALVINDNKSYNSFSADSIGFSLIGGYFGDSPFGFSTPNVFSPFSVNAYSRDLNTLSDVGFEQLLKFDNLFPGTAELSFYNPDDGFSVTAFSRLTSGGFSVAAVPEPATWSMMIIGMGVVGFAMRRKSKAASRVSDAV